MLGFISIFYKIKIKSNTPLGVKYILFYLNYIIKNSYFKIYFKKYFYKLKVFKNKVITYKVGRLKWLWTNHFGAIIYINY